MRRSSWVWDEWTLVSLDPISLSVFVSLSLSLKKGPELKEWRTAKEFCTINWRKKGGCWDRVLWPNIWDRINLISIWNGLWKLISNYGLTLSPIHPVSMLVFLGVCNGLWSLTTVSIRYQHFWSPILVSNGLDSWSVLPRPLIGIQTLTILYDLLLVVNLHKEWSRLWRPYL